MPTTRATFSTGLKVAIESSYSVAPNSSTNSGYWQGGRWFDITTDGLPDLDDRQATIFPQGQAGKRAMNNRRPVIGRKWSDGSFNYEITSDFFPVIAYAGMGSLSSNMIPSTQFELLAEEPVAGGASKLLVLADQPSDGGALLRFYLTGTSVGGWFSVSGIDSYGNGASEVISFSSAGSFWTRTSFSAIGASGISVWSDNAAPVTSPSRVSAGVSIEKFCTTIPVCIRVLLVAPAVGSPCRSILMDGLDVSLTEIICSYAWTP